MTIALAISQLQRLGDSRKRKFGCVYHSHESICVNDNHRSTTSSAFTLVPNARTSGGWK
jgi:hypothetical protein